MRGKEYNPVIGYLLIDDNNHVMGPPGEAKDVAFYSEARALKAAEGYGQQAQVKLVSALHLRGILSVVWDDVGDIYLDGAAAQRLVKACARRGIKVKKKAKQRLKRAEVSPVYSSRALLEDNPNEHMF